MSKRCPQPSAFFAALLLCLATALTPGRATACTATWVDPVDGTVALGTTTCSDTSSSVTLAAGDYVEVRVTGQGNTNGTVGFSVEIADP